MYSEIQLKQLVINLPSRNKSKKRTFLDISGIGHREIYLSNIFAFFLESGEAHGMGTFLGDIILELVAPLSGAQTVWVTKREVMTQSGYIDIVLESNNVVIVIENKIYADLYNNLNDYYECIKNTYPTGTVIIPIVLGLRLSNEDTDNLGIWKFHSYKSFVKTIRTHQLRMPASTNSYYKLLFDDFLINLEHLIEGELYTMDPKLQQFIITNKKELIDVRNVIKDYESALKKLLNNTRENIMLQTPHNFITPPNLSIYIDNNLMGIIGVSGFIKEGVLFYVDIMCDGSEFTLRLTKGKDSLNALDLLSLAEELKVSGEIKDGWFYINKKYTVEGTSDELIVEITRILRDIVGYSVVI